MCVRRWLFSIDRELSLPNGEQAAKFIFYQAVDEVNRNNIRADGRLYELKALQDAKKAHEYLTLGRTLSGYGDVVFPHCACDSRKEGHVIPAVGMSIYIFFSVLVNVMNCLFLKLLIFHFILCHINKKKKKQKIGMKSFRLIACREDGTLESQTVELTWDMISQWESDEESMAFCFQYSRNDKPARWVKVQTPYVSFFLLPPFFVILYLISNQL